MQQRNTNLIGQNRNIVLIAIATALVLLVPLIAMQFSDDVVWSWFDFVAAGVLLFGSGLAFELLARRAGSTMMRVVIGVGCAAVLLFVWAQLAVGILGD